MKYAQAIPEKGPVEIRVNGFGWQPQNHLPFMNLIINEGVKVRVIKKLGKWVDSNDSLFTSEAQGFLQTVWENECRKHSIPKNQW